MLVGVCDGVDGSDWYGGSVGKDEVVEFVINNGGGGEEWVNIGDKLGDGVGVLRPK